jgi:hypothetical protein
VQINKETIEVYAERARNDLKAEGDRAEQFNQRGTAFLGFAGITLALTATQGRELVGQEATLGALGQGLAIGLIALAAALIALGGLVVIPELLPREGDFFQLALGEYERFGSPEYATREPVSALGNLMLGDIVFLAKQREVNDRKVRRLRTAAKFLAAGLVALALDVIVVLASLVFQL